MKPLIIISPSVDESEREIKLSRAYFEAVRLAGGTALVSDYGDIEELLERADGILLSGGGDIEPALTGDIPDDESRGQVSRARDEFEFELVRKAVERDMPVLGICRGMQVIGGAFGGHIIQHMEGHMQTEPKNVPSHAVTIAENSLLFKITQTRSMKVNSFHHQAVGEGFLGKITAVSADGFAEALEIADKSFVLGIQWHPELLTESIENLNIFKRFTEAAGRYREK